MEVHLQATKAKQELITIAIKNTESVSKYYHRIFKLWTRANTPIDKKIVKFTRLLKPSISTPLPSCKFTSIRTVLDKVRDIKDVQKEITYKFLRQNNKQQQSSSKFSCRSNSYSFVTIGGSTSISRGSAATNRGLEGKDKKLTAFKLVGWSGTWYNPDSKPKKLKNNNKMTLLRQGCCWACCGSG